MAPIGVALPPPIGLEKDKKGKAKIGDQLTSSEEDSMKEAWKKKGDKVA